MIGLGIFMSIVLFNGATGIFLVLLGLVLFARREYIDGWWDRVRSYPPPKAAAASLRVDREELWKNHARLGHPIVPYNYRGKTHDVATQAFRADTIIAARYGYRPTSQLWVQGQWGCGAFLIAVLLFIVLVGILVFLYMILVKPEGSLAVTYSLQGIQAASKAPEPPDQPSPLGEATKVCPDCAETVKAAARVCRYCRHEFGPRQ